MSQLAPNQKKLLDEGAARAKNMGVAAFMIVVLLVRYFFVKIVWKRVEKLLAIVIVKTAQVLSQVYRRLKPRIEHWRKIALETSNQAIRVGLGLLITVLTPLEGLLLRFFGLARAQSEKLAAASGATFASVFGSIFAALGGVLKAGLSKPALQRALMRILQLVADAEKA